MLQCGEHSNKWNMTAVFFHVNLLTVGCSHYVNQTAQIWFAITTGYHSTCEFCDPPQPWSREPEPYVFLGSLLKCPNYSTSFSKMASMRDSDTGLWLHNKLGSTDELWAPPSIASLLTVSVIDNIRLCFSSLSPPVKLKLLLGMLHLPRRTVDEVCLRVAMNSNYWLQSAGLSCYLLVELWTAEELSASLGNLNCCYLEWSSLSCIRQTEMVGKPRLKRRPPSG